MILPPGSTSISLTVQIVDDAGLPVTGLAAATFPAVYYIRDGESLPAAVSLSDLAAQNSAYSSGGVKELAGGMYRFDAPNAAFATASRVRIVGEASGKRLLYPVILVANVPSILADVPHGGSSANLTLAAVAISGGLVITQGLSITGTTLGAAVDIIAGALGKGLSITSTNDTAVSIFANAATAVDVSTNNGVGLSIAAVGTNHVAVSLSATAGHGVSITASGASKHGLTITGGTSGTSHAVLLTAGTGGQGLLADTVTVSGALTAGTNALPWNADWDAEVQSEAADALTAYGAATSTEVTAIQNNTRVVRVVPAVVERPDSGTVTYRIELLLYDTAGSMEPPDSAPTIALVNQSGTDLSSRLDSTTMALVSTGRYRAVYTASVGDTLEQLVWTFSVVEGGATRLYGNTTVIVDTTAVDFTAADRTKLERLDTDYTTARAVKIDSLDATISSRASQASVDAIDDFLDTEVAAILAAVDTETAAILAAVDTEVGAIKAKTDLLNADVATWATRGLTMIEADGPVYRYTTNALEQGPSGAGTDPLLNIVPGSYASGTAGAALGRIGTGIITTTSPVAQDGDVSITAGDDYLAADGRAIDWTGASANIWPDLTGAAIHWNVDDGRLIVTGSVVTPTGTQKVRAEPTAAQTALLGEGGYDFGVVATLANGHVVTLVRGRVDVADSEGS